MKFLVIAAILGTVLYRHGNTKTEHSGLSPMQINMFRDILEQLNS